MTPPKEVNVADVMAEVEAIRGSSNTFYDAQRVYASWLKLRAVVKQLQGTNKDLSDFLVSKNEYLGELEAKLTAAKAQQSKTVWVAVDKSGEAHVYKDEPYMVACTGMFAGWIPKITDVLGVDVTNGGKIEVEITTTRKV